MLVCHFNRRKFLNHFFYFAGNKKRDFLKAERNFVELNNALVHSMEPNNYNFEIGFVALSEMIRKYVDNWLPLD